MEKLIFNIQLFAAEENTNVAADLEPGISLDFVSKIGKNITELQKILGIAELQPMNAGNTIKIYRTEVGELAEQVGEGETIGLTKVTRKLARTIEVVLKKYRRNTPAESIQKSGRNRAINECDEKLVTKVQGGIKGDFFTTILAGEGVVTGGTFQQTLANAWAQLVTYYEDEGVTPIHFISPLDVAEYLGTANITMQTAFGLSYVEDFLGLGTVVVSPRVTKGKVVSTAKENLCGAYIPANTGDVARTFGLTSDRTGLIGITHQPITSNATVDTLMMSGVVFYPEFIDGVFVGTITPAAGA